MNNQAKLTAGLVVVILLILFGLSAVSDVYAQDSTPTPGMGQGGQQDQQLIQQGQGVYSNNCAGCHGPNGEGNRGPAHAGNEFTTQADPLPVIETVLTGREDMPPFRDRLSSEQIAAVVSYIRNAFGNSASTVTVEQVEQAAADTAGQGGQVQQTPTAQPGDQQGQQPQQTPTAQPGGQQQTYTVQAGDTLTSIANQFGVTLEQLVAANPNLLTAGTQLNIPVTQGGVQQPGQQGTVPQTGPSLLVQRDDFSGFSLLHPFYGSDAPAGFGNYVVRTGDSLAVIADQFGTTIDQLMVLNPHIPNPNLIFRGQRLIVPSGEQPLNNPPGSITGPGAQNQTQ